MNDAELSQEELFTLLRPSGVRHLGQVRDAFMEQSGKASMFTRQLSEAPPGLPIVPPWDLESPKTISAETPVDPDHYACLRCGRVVDAGAQTRLGQCPNCGHEKWTRAVGKDT